MAQIRLYAVVSMEDSLVKCLGVYPWHEALGIATASAQVLDLTDERVTRISPLEQIVGDSDEHLGYYINSYTSEYAISVSKRIYILKDCNVTLTAGSLLESTYVSDEDTTGESDV